MFSGGLEVEFSDIFKGNKSGTLIENMLNKYLSFK